MTGGVLLLIVFFGGLLILPPLFRVVVMGRMSVQFIEDDGYVRTKLKKPKYDNEYIIDGDGAYDIIPECVGLTTFPKGLPAFFQSIVPFIQYRRDDPNPTYLKNPVVKAVSAREIKASLEPHHLKALVTTSREGIEVTRWQKMAPTLIMAVAGLALLMTLVIYSRMTGGVGG